MAMIECQSELDIKTAEPLRQQLLNALQSREPLEIDSRAVNKVHTSVLQLFLSFVTEAQAQGLSVRWRNPAPALMEGARLLGLTDRLGLGEAETR